MRVIAAFNHSENLSEVALEFTPDVDIRLQGETASSPIHRTLEPAFPTVLRVLRNEGSASSGAAAMGMGRPHRLYI